MGSCAIVAVVLDDTYVVANAGDCQAVLVSNGSGSVLGHNICEVHSSNRRSEQERLIREHPGEEDIVCCTSENACYVKGRLMPTRAFGDMHLKHEEFNNPKRYSSSFGFQRPPIEHFRGPYVTHRPDVQVRTIGKGDRYLILASDGLWDELTEQEAAEIAFRAKDPQEAAKKLVEAALEHAAREQRIPGKDLLDIPLGKRRVFHDDITVVVVPL